MSRYPEIARLSDATSKVVIEHMKSFFSRHGIPEEVRSDNGPQYSSAAFAKFASEYKFSHITSSPLQPQSNGEAERMVRTVKSLLKKATDPYLALLAYRATPLANGFSPSELLMKDRFDLLCRNYLTFYTEEYFLGRRFKRKKQLVKKTKKEDSASDMQLKC